MLFVSPRQIQRRESLIEPKKYVCKKQMKIALFLLFRIAKEMNQHLADI
jgi:hypothetical protein